jgi:hypothetical protein
MKGGVSQSQIIFYFCQINQNKNKKHTRAVGFYKYGRATEKKTTIFICDNMP